MGGISPRRLVWSTSRWFFIVLGSKLAKRGVLLPGCNSKRLCFFDVYNIAWWFFNILTFFFTTFLKAFFKDQHTKRWRNMWISPFAHDWCCIFSFEFKIHNFFSTIFTLYFRTFPRRIVNYGCTIRKKRWFKELLPRRLAWFFFVFEIIEGKVYKKNWKNLQLPDVSDKN